MDIFQQASTRQTIAKAVQQAAGTVAYAITFQMQLTHRISKLLRPPLNMNIHTRAEQIRASNNSVELLGVASRGI